MKIAVLDDYALASPRLADWSDLGDVTVFQDTIAGTDLVGRLLPFDVICLMRERTPMGADLIAQLPNLRLIVTSGPRNASIDLPAARCPRCRNYRLRHQKPQDDDVRANNANDARPEPPPYARGRKPIGRRLAIRPWPRCGGADAGADRAGQYRRADGGDW